MHCCQVAADQPVSQSLGVFSARDMSASEIESLQSQRPTVRETSESPPVKRPGKEAETMAHVPHPLQADPASPAALRRCRGADAGVRAGLRAFSSRVSVFRRIMPESTWHR